MLERLGSPKSSPSSSSSYSYMSSGSSAAQSSLVFERKFAYVLIGGEERPELVLFSGGDVVLIVVRVDVDGGGVRGRDAELDRFLFPVG